jgi:hypothetical protein
VFNRSGLVGSRALPPAMAGRGGDAVAGGVIPAAHVQQNGVAVGGQLACFVGGTDPAQGSGALSEASLYCLHTVSGRWSKLNCSTPHKGGGVARAGMGTILVGGGFDPGSPDCAPTDVVDVFTFQPPSAHALECQSTITKLCGDAKRASAGSCFVCAGQHASALRRVGCSEQDLDRFCSPASTPRNEGLQS